MPFIILLLLVSVVSAAPVSLTPERIAETTRTHHPALQAARLRIAEARARHRGAGRLSNPELGLSVNRNRRLRDGTTEVTLDQKFPLTARLRLERTLTLGQIEMAELEVREMERQFVAEARTLAVRRLVLAAKEDLWKRQKTVAEALAEFARGQVAKGELSPLDAGQLALEQTRLELEGRNLHREALTVEGALRTAIGLAPDSPLKLAGKLGSPLLPPLSRRWQQRPDYRLALLREKNAGVETELARARRWEEVSAGVTWEHDGVEKESFFGVRVGIPLPLWNRNEGEIGERKAARVRAGLETRALREAIAQEVATAHAEMSTGAALARESLEKWLPLARKQAADAEAAYRRGESDLFTLLRAREQQLQMEAAAIDNLGGFHLSRIRYEASIDQP